MELITLDNLGDDFLLDVINQKIYNTNIATGASSPNLSPVVVSKNWLWLNTTLNKLTHYWNGVNWIVLTVGSVKTTSTITATGVFPNSDIIFFGNGATSMTGTIPTSSMIVGQLITIKRNTGATGALTLRGQSGSIQALNNTLVTQTTLANAGSYGQCVTFIWNGTNLLRIS